MRLPGALPGPRTVAAWTLGVASIATTIRVRNTILGARPKATGGAAVIGRGVLRQPKTRNKASIATAVMIQAAILLPRRNLNHLFWILPQGCCLVMPVAAAW